MSKTTIILGYHGPKPIRDVYLIFLENNQIVGREHIIFDATENIEAQMLKLMDEFKKNGYDSIFSRKYEKSMFKKVEIIPRWGDICDIYTKTTPWKWIHRHEACKNLGIDVSRWEGQKNNSKATCEMLCEIYFKLATYIPPNIQ